MGASSRLVASWMSAPRTLREDSSTPVCWRDVSTRRTALPYERVQLPSAQEKQ